jgi:hypothetical protein
MKLPCRQRFAFIRSNLSVSLLLKAGRNLQGMIALFGQLLLDVAFLFKAPADIPWREFRPTSTRPAPKPCR